MLADLGGWKLIILVVMLLVLFGGATKLPLFAKGLGQSIKIFKREVQDLRTEGAPDENPKPSVSALQGVEPEAPAQSVAVSTPASAPAVGPAR